MHRFREHVGGKYRFPRMRATSPVTDCVRQMVYIRVADAGDGHWPASPQTLRSRQKDLIEKQLAFALANRLARCWHHTCFVHSALTRLSCGRGFVYTDVRVRTFNTGGTMNSKEQLTEEHPQQSAASGSKRALLKFAWVAPVITLMNLPRSGF